MLNYLGYKKFDGYDFMELAYAWGIYIPDESYDKKFGEPFSEDYHYIQEFLNYFVFKRNSVELTRFGKRVVNDIRLYCKAMNEWAINVMEMDRNEIWEGFSKEDNDYELIRLFIPLVPYAWN